MAGAPSPRVPRHRAGPVVGALTGLLLVAYPLVVWLGLTQGGGARRTASILLAVAAPLAALRLRGARSAAARSLAGLPLVTVALLLGAAVLDAGGLMLVVPVAINAVLLASFAVTLRHGSLPMVERFARLRLREPTSAQRAWCRMWTRVWCGFFVVNGVVAAVLAGWAPLRWWAAWTGLISYALIGLLFATEYLLRHRRFHRGGVAPGVPILAPEADSGSGPAVAGRWGRAELLANARRIASALDARAGAIVFAFERDLGAFAAALLATWMTGSTARLPEHSRRRLVGPLLDAPGSTGFVHDTGLGRPLDVPRLLRGQAGEGHHGSASPPPAVAIESFGGVGVATPHARSVAPPPSPCPGVTAQRWTSAALRAELDAARDLLELRGDDVLLTSLAPSSFPATLLAVLAPLAAGASFHAEVPTDADALLRVLAARRATVLVTAPSHLRAVLQTATHRDPFGGLRRIVVCGAAADPAALALCRARFGGSVSTAFDQLDPALRDPAAVAVAGRLLARPEVRDAVVIPRRGHDELLALVVAPGADAAELGRAIGADGERPLRCRLTHALPRDPNGQLDAATVHELFGLGADGAELEHGFVWSGSAVSSAGGHRFDVDVPERSACYRGHFPGYPVLAGAVQLAALIAPAVRRARPDLGPIGGWSALKFPARILPGDRLVIRLRLDDPERGGRFEIRRGDDLCSTGRMTFLGRVAP